MSTITQETPTRAVRGPQAAIQACVASLAAEAYDLGHPRAARLLAQAASMLSDPSLWVPEADR